MPYRFAPRLIPTIVTLLLLPVLISLGQWQKHRAEFKQHLQDSYDLSVRAAPQTIGGGMLDAATMQYHRVKTRGRYEQAYQILLDNQIWQGKAGYQVVTPLHIDGSTMRILVNRGWVAAYGDRRVPEIETPNEVVEVSGVLTRPTANYIELSQTQSPAGSWQTIWQNLNLERYSKAVPFPLQPMVIELDPASSAGGFVRDWPRPDAKVEMHKGYEFQWRALALMLVIYYLIASIRKRT